ncbi:hypothetical protein PAHAL_2G411300 [Panicum hallii]|nr:hypothetical protein PAHAL_2G411300 [Panicum hallii]
MRSICPALNSPRPPSPPPHPGRIPRNRLLLPTGAACRSLAIADLTAASIVGESRARRASNRRGYRRRKERGGMVFFCFLVDQRRTVRSSKPAAGICSRCGGCASVADMETATRVCYLLTVHRRTWRAIICTFCGAMLKSYRHYRLY